MTQAQPQTARPPRVLFLSGEAPDRAGLAVAWAAQLGPERLEGRAASLHPGVGQPSPVTQAIMAEAGLDSASFEVPAIDPELLDWADLIVTLDAAAAEHHASAAPSTPAQHWELPAQQPEPEAAAPGTTITTPESANTTAAAPPAATTDTAPDQAGASWLRHTRDEIKRQLHALMAWIEKVGGPGINP